MATKLAKASKHFMVKVPCEEETGRGIPAFGACKTPENIFCTIQMNMPVLLGFIKNLISEMS